MDRYFLLKDSDKIYFCEREIIDTMGIITISDKRIAVFDVNLVSMLVTTGMIKLQENK